MRLTTESGTEADPATTADIERVFSDESARGDFVILEQEPELYLQALFSRSGCHVEYRAGSADRHYRSTNECSLSETQDLFLDYLEGAPDWQTPLNWAPLSTTSTPRHPWWKLW